MEQMPMWGPPTPPTTDNDVYVDYSLGFLYEFTPISEAQLPPIYVRKENLKRKSDTIMSERDGRRPAKTRHKEESMYAPRSLFDRTMPGMLKMNRGMKMHRYRASMVRSPMQPANMKPSPVLKPLTEQDNILEWMIHEDWALLQAVQVYQDLPLDLVCQYPGHTPNWDFVADIVNNTSRIYRSPKQCRNRYESVIVPREEGKLFYDTSPKKKKQKNLCKIPQVAEQQSKTNRPMKTLQLYNADKNYSFTSMSIQRFDIIKDLEMTNRKTLVAKGVHPSASPKNSKHMTVLIESNIQYDCPLSPLEVASRRAERIAKEKLKNAVNSQQAAAVRLQQQQQQQQQIQIQQQQSQSQAQTTASTLPQTHQLVQSALSTVSSQTVATLKTTNTVTNVSVTAANVVTAAVKSRVAATLNMQEVRTTPAVVSMSNLQGAQRLSTTSGLVPVSPNIATAAGTQKSIVGVTVATPSGNKTMITPAQLQYYRQLQMRQQMKVLQAPAGGGQKVQVAVSSSPATAQQRATLMKQQQQGSNVAGNSSSPGTVVKQTITRPVTDTEMALLKQRQAALQQQQTKMTQMQVPAQTGLTPAQIFAQAGLQVQQQACASSAGGTSVATLVKTTNVAGVRAATPQQIRQLALHSQLLAQRKLPGQKVAQLAQVAGKAGVSTQLIVQPKPLPVTMQQIQQAMKSTNMQQFTHVTSGQSVSQPSQVVLAKSPLHTRVIPVASASLKQTIQVVTASNAQLRQTSPAQSKPVNTNRGSPGPSQVRLQTISHQVHPQQIQQPPSQQSQESQQK